MPSPAVRDSTGPPLHTLLAGPIALDQIAVVDPSRRIAAGQKQFLRPSQKTFLGFVHHLPASYTN